MSRESIKKFTTEFAGFLDAMKMLAEIEDLDNEYAAAKHRVGVARKQAEDIVAQGEAERAKAQAEGQKLLDDTRAKCDELKAAAARAIKSDKERAEAELALIQNQRERVETQITGLRKHAEDQQAALAAARTELGGLNDAINTASELHEGLKAQIAKIKQSLGA